MKIEEDIVKRIEDANHQHRRLKDIFDAFCKNATSWAKENKEFTTRNIDIDILSSSNNLEVIFSGMAIRFYFSTHNDQDHLIGNIKVIKDNQISPKHPCVIGEFSFDRQRKTDFVIAGDPQEEKLEIDYDVIYIICHFLDLALRKEAPVSA